MVYLVKCPACEHEFTTDIECGEASTKSAVTLPCPHCRNRFDVRGNHIKKL